MSSGRGSRTTRSERLRAALVCAQPPAGSGRVVDGAPDERMTKAEPPGHVGRTQEIDAQQLVDDVHHRRLGHPARGRGELAVERIACHRRSFQHEALRVGQQRELLRQRRRDRRRDADRRALRLVEHRRRLAGTAGRAGELLEVERVAATLDVEAARLDAVDGVAQQLAGLVGAEGLEVDPRQQLGAPRPLERSGEALGDVMRPHGEPQQHRRRGRPAEEGSDQLQRRGVGPVEIVEHEHERLRRPELLEQRAHGAVAAIALVLERDLAVARQRRQGRKHVRELRAHVVLQAGEARRAERSHVLVERVHEDRERQVALQLGSRACEHQVPLCVRARAELGEEAGLADSRLADDQDGDRAALVELRQRPIERAQLLGAPDEVGGLQRHSSCCRA